MLDTRLTDGAGDDLSERHGGKGGQSEHEREKRIFQRYDDDVSKDGIQ